MKQKNSKLAAVRSLLMLGLWCAVPAMAQAQEVQAQIVRKAGDVIAVNAAANTRFSFSTAAADSYSRGVYYGPMVDFGGMTVFRVSEGAAAPSEPNAGLEQVVGGHRYVLSGSTITDYDNGTNAVCTTIETGLTQTATALTAVPEERRFVITLTDGGATSYASVEVAPFRYERDGGQQNVLNVAKADGTTLSMNVGQLEDMYYTEAPSNSPKGEDFGSLPLGRDGVGLASYSGTPVWMGECHYFLRRQLGEAPAGLTFGKSLTLNGTTYTIATDGVITFGDYRIETCVAKASGLAADCDSRRLVVSTTDGKYYEVVFPGEYAYLGTEAASSSTARLALAAADWGWQSLSGGAEYGSARFANLIAGTQSLSVVRYPEASYTTSLVSKEGTANAKGTDVLAANEGAAFAINGSYFDMTNYTSETALWIDNTMVATTTDDHAVRCTGLVAFKDGKVAFEKYDAKTITDTELATLKEKYDAFIASGHLLRINNTSLSPYANAGSTFMGVNPRSMIGVTADRTVYMVVVDGRNDGVADGLTIEQMGKLAEALGLTDALNLDGGGSSCLWVSGQGVINTPSGGSVRKVPNIIIAK